MKKHLTFLQRAPHIFIFEGLKWPNFLQHEDKYALFEVLGTGFPSQEELLVMVTLGLQPQSI